MKWSISPFNLLLSGLLGGLLLAALFPGAAPRVSGFSRGEAAGRAAGTPDAPAADRSVQVSGSATVKVVPDRALIQLGVQSNGATPSEVQYDNLAAMQRVLDALQAQGIAAQDIASDIYWVDPLYESYDSLSIKGYRIEHVVAVTLRDVSRTGVVVAAALEAGANQVLQVEFYTSELRKYRDQARDLAVKAAREKADALAASAGAQAGQVLSISENTWSTYNGGWYGRSRELWVQNTLQNAPAAGEAPNTGGEPLSLGTISVRAEVSAAFELR